MATEPNTSYVALLATSNLIGKECLQANRDFVLCKQRDEEPAACVEQGEKVTACVLKVLRQCEENCGDAYAGYQKCLKEKNRDTSLCRKDEAALEKCWSSLPPVEK